MTLFRRFFENRSGNTGIIFALALIPVATGIGAAIDYSRAASARTQMQGLTDSAALAGAMSSDPSDSGRTAAATAFFQGSSIPDLKSNPTLSVAVANNRVSVTADANVGTSLMGMISIKQIAIETRATAGPAQSGLPVCALALNKTASSAISFGGNTTFTGKSCSIYANSTSSSAISVGGNASVTAAGTCSAGGVSGSFSPPAQTHCPQVADPFASIATTVAGSCGGNNNVSISPHTTTTLTSGTYCGGLDIKGTVTLNPGLYIISGALTISSQATVTGSGVTFYLVGPSASFTINGGGNINISAMTTGLYAGMAIVQDRASNPGATNTLNGNSGTTIKGAVYTPTQTLAFSGNGSFGQADPFMPIIADQLSFTGNSTVTVQADTSAMQPVAPLAKMPGGAMLTN